MYNLFSLLIIILTENAYSSIAEGSDMRAAIRIESAGLISNELLSLVRPIKITSIKKNVYK